MALLFGIFLRILWLIGLLRTSTSLRPKTCRTTSRVILPHSVSAKMHVANEIREGISQYSRFAENTFKSAGGTIECPFLAIQAHITRLNLTSNSELAFPKLPNEFQSYWQVCR